MTPPKAKEGIEEQMRKKIIGSLSIVQLYDVDEAGELAIEVERTMRERGMEL